MSLEYHEFGMSKFLLTYFISLVCMHCVYNTEDIIIIFFDISSIKTVLQIWAMDISHNQTY